MATKPTGEDLNITWAESGPCIEPSSGQKATGWEEGDQPNNKWWNWLQRSAGRWMRYLRDFEDSAHIWTALNTFRGLAGDTNAAVRFDATPAYRKLIFEFGASGRRGRIYWRGALEFELTLNCVWESPARWAPDDIDYDSTMMRIGGSRIEIYSHASGVAHWDDMDANWTEKINVGGLGWISFEKILAGDNGSNPPADRAMKNAVCAKNTCKAWGLIHSAYNSGSPIFTVIDGFNIHQAGVVGGALRVTFAQPMANANFAPLLTPMESYAKGGPGPSPYNTMMPFISWKDPAYVEIKSFFRDGTPGGYGPSQDFDIFVVVFGEQ